MGFATICAVLVVSALAASSNTATLWPKPSNYSYDPAGPALVVSPCSIKFSVTSPEKIYIEEIITHYQIKVFGCAKIDQGKVELAVTTKNAGQFTATNLTHEKYTLTLHNETKWALKADYYVGFLRGMETFAQLFNKLGNGSYEVKGFPIAITDGPQFLWRGLMIDTARHFLSVDSIKRAIDGMLYTKLNVLHWHIVDDDAFPMNVPAVPELSESGSIGGTYSPVDVKTVIAYARMKGVRVVPEIDTPAHTESWGRSQKYKDIVLNCGDTYQGQLDPTMDLTFELLKTVFTYVNSTFDDQYVHLGGEEMVLNCWKQRESIVKYMQAKGLNSTKDLAVDYRTRQKKMFRDISAKKTIYWVDQKFELPVQADDVIQWMGSKASQAKLAGLKNEVILSNSQLVNLDVGFGDIYGKSTGAYHNWRTMYGFTPVITNVNVIGGTTCMWNELGTRQTFDQKVIQKASVLGERLWNSNVNINSELNNIATRLQAQAERFRARGYKVWPVTVEICEKSMGLCF